MKKGFVSVIIFLVIGFLLGGLAIFSYFQFKPELTLQTKHVANSQLSPKSDSQAVPDITANWKTYSSQDGRTSIKYPADWVVSECIAKPDFLFVGFGYSTETSSCGDTSDFSLVQILFPLSKSFDKVIETFIYKEVDGSYPYINFDQKTITFNEKKALRTTGIYNSPEHPFGLDKSNMIDYLLQAKNGEVLRLTYTQKQGWQDKSEIFETMVKTLMVN